MHCRMLGSIPGLSVLTRSTMLLSCCGNKTRVQALLVYPIRDTHHRAGTTDSYLVELPPPKFFLEALSPTVTVFTGAFRR